nr:hypothetical protein BOSE7B_40757 [Bosea sp. 7B]
MASSSCSCLPAACTISRASGAPCAQATPGAIWGSFARFAMFRTNLASNASLPGSDVPTRVTTDCACALAASDARP